MSVLVFQKSMNRIVKMPEEAWFEYHNHPTGTLYASVI